MSSHVQRTVWWDKLCTVAKQTWRLCDHKATALARHTVAAGQHAVQ
jgi:hypothetical protein